NGPVVPDKFKEALRVSLLWSQAGKTIHDLLGTFERMVKAATQAKYLANPWPTACQKVIEFRRSNQGSLLNPTMACINRLRQTPIAAIHRRFGKKELQILFERGLITLGKEEVISTRRGNTGTRLRMRMQRICAEDPPFYIQRREKLLHTGLFTLFVFH